LRRGFLTRLGGRDPVADSVCSSKSRIMLGGCFTVNGKERKAGCDRDAGMPDDAEPRFHPRARDL
jgi:hypothetical protein